MIVNFFETQIFFNYFPVIKYQYSKPAFSQKIYQEIICLSSKIQRCLNKVVPSHTHIIYQQMIIEKPTSVFMSIKYFCAYNNKMFSQGQEQYNKTIDHRNIIQELNNNIQNYRILFQKQMPQQLQNQNSLILDKIETRKDKIQLIKYINQKNTRDKIINLIKDDTTVTDLIEYYGEIFKNQDYGKQYNFFSKNMQGKTNNTQGFSLSNQYQSLLRKASKCHKPKLIDLAITVKRTKQLVCQYCHIEQVNKPGQSSHQVLSIYIQRACPSKKIETKSASTQPQESNKELPKGSKKQKGNKSIIHE